MQQPAPHGTSGSFGTPGTDPWGAQPTYSPAAPPRRRSIAPWWVSLILLSVGLLLGFVWFIIGGLPFTNHAAYGRVPVPGAGQVTLPAGTVWIHFEEQGVFGENDSADMPNDLVVAVQAPSGAQVPIERLSSNLFSVSNDNVGHVPYGRLEVTSAGRYLVATAAGSSSAVLPRVTFGEPPWNPFGPPIVGAAVFFAPFALIALVLLLPLRRVAPAPVMVRF